MKSWKIVDCEGATTRRAVTIHQRRTNLSGRNIIGGILPSDEVPQSIKPTTTAAFYYISLVTRARDGQVFTTWNYPFSYSLKFGPDNHVLRVRAEASFSSICQAHRSFLARNSVSPDEVPSLEPGQMQSLLQNDLRSQITHNVAAGLLAPETDGKVRYTWRGLFYVWLRFLWDLIR